MNEGVTILVVEDDDGHASLAERNLRRVGIANPVKRFKDGQTVLDFLLVGPREHPTPEAEAYLMLLDVRMPGVSGLEVLAIVKQHERWRRMPVIILTTTDSQAEVDQCHALGCNAFITKPAAYDEFVEVMERIGRYLLELRVPCLD